MKRAFVLLTALPPTRGHLQLIQFAHNLAERGVTVIVSTQPEEPYALQRYLAVSRATERAGLRNTRVIWHHKTMEQDPTTPGFKELWWGLMRQFGAEQGDYIIASEVYGQWLAEGIGAAFYPYDIDRSISSARATNIRRDPLDNFATILPEFQQQLTIRITVFGAESTGKTTLSRDLAKRLNGHWLFEYARPYLENTVNEITKRSMAAIWKGQRALQKQASVLMNKPFIVQDTDLFSTVGYWQFEHWQTTIGAPSRGLIEDAIDLRSDLYIVTKSNIPFEADPLRYGGDHRKGSDEYWENVCKRYDLPYIVLESTGREERLDEAVAKVRELAAERFSSLSYVRKGQ